MNRSKDELNMILEELQKKQEFIFTQAKQSDLSRHTIAPVLEELCMRISKIMSCDRVSIWLFNESHTTLTMQNSFHKKDSAYSSGVKIFAKELPSYFEAVQQERILAIEDASTDPVTKELRQHPFYDEGEVKSLIDASIILGKGIGGVVCCDSTELRKWSYLDRVLVASIADMLSYIFDRLERIEVEEHVQQLAYTDQLTGLDNEYSFAEKVTKQIASFKEGQRGIFYYLVMDQFTEMQGVLGPDGADLMIQITANRLKKLFPYPSQTARLAFDHFVIFSPFDGELENEKAKMELIVNKLKQPMHVSGQEVYMTFSYGASVYPEHASNVKYGIQAAYMALQSGKVATNRKSGIVYNPEMHTYLKETMLSEMNLRRGLDMNEFQLHYQPQVNCRTGEVIGFEALIRWQHPERGLIFPGDFIELAESTGLITPIGEWVIQQAANQIREWNEQGLNNVTVSVNLSPRHFLHHNLPFFLEKCITEANIKPKSLVLEITENVAMEDTEAVAKRIHLLKEMGYFISIDDFGKGYSAFIYLQHFPIQQIKIDRQFINGLGKNPKSSGIVQTIIHLAEMLGLQTIGEGVETKEQWDILKGFGCSELQGFYFSRPIPVDEINEMIRKYGRGGKLLLPSA
ncbi:GGDEF and EAL domain-containing protein [Sporosarcina sp. ACRSL]|uniref:sensor domain-containing phosphodiesterase n=1 Tax=Sporosarcina sp. ACRSL TaxID=2918215 RepID=UPI001EF683FF|nr:GGDEF and EAL domain-containing protein [Sporosarcina sp. ACRSL]MCG7344299.1 GGDEF and EAL domain-containing protein [Sporosarcina sp. ACRSL]